MRGASSSPLTWSGIHRCDASEEISAKTVTASRCGISSCVEQRNELQVETLTRSGVRTVSSCCRQWIIHKRTCETHRSCSLLSTCRWRTKRECDQLGTVTYCPSLRKGQRHSITPRPYHTTPTTLSSIIPLTFAIPTSALKIIGAIQWTCGGPSDVHANPIRPKGSSGAAETVSQVNSSQSKPNPTRAGDGDRVVLSTHCRAATKGASRVWRRGCWRGYAVAWREGGCTMRTRWSSLSRCYGHE